MEDSEICIETPITWTWNKRPRSVPNSQRTHQSSSIGHTTIHATLKYGNYAAFRLAEMLHQVEEQRPFRASFNSLPAWRILASICCCCAISPCHICIEYHLRRWTQVIDASVSWIEEEGWEAMDVSLQMVKSGSGFGLFALQAQDI